MYWTLRGEVCGTMELQNLMIKRLMDGTVEYELRLLNVDALSVQPPTVGYKNGRSSMVK